MPAPKDPEKYRQWIENLSNSKKGEPNKGHFKKGQTPWNKGVPRSDETLEKLRQANLGKKHSEETKGKISQLLKGNTHRLGIKLSPEHKKAISEASKGNKNTLGKKLTDEHKRRIRDWSTGRKHTPETILKMKSISGKRIKKYWDKMSREERRERCANWIEAGLKTSGTYSISSLEVAIAKILDCIQEPYEQQYKFKGYYIDFYLPKRKQFIECNGEYWHSLPKRKRRDKILEELCFESNIKLTWLWESEIKKDPSKALLKSLG